MTQNGKYKCPINVTINIQNIQDKFYEILEQTLAELTSDYLNENTDETDVNTSEFDGDDCVNIQGIMQGDYTQSYFAATFETPEENDIDLSPEDFNNKALTDYINKHLFEALETNFKTLTPIQNKIDVRTIDIDFDNIDLTPSEPDWDAMPGGYDDI